MKEFWNQRYDSPHYSYGLNPNEFLRENIDTMVPGKILLPGDGEGRNAVFAAKLGWDVTAVDYSEKGKHKALKLADLNKVTINYQLSDLVDFRTSSNYYDLIAFSYLHLPAKIRRSTHRRSIEWLRRGGRVILEAFSTDQLSRKSGGPNNIEMLYTIEDIENDFAVLHTEILTKTITHLNEGNGHSGEASVIRFVGTKP